MDMVFGHYELGLPTPEEAAREYVGDAADDYDMDAVIKNLAGIFDDIYRRYDIHFIPDDDKGMEPERDNRWNDPEWADDREQRYRDVMEEIKAIDWPSILVPAN